MKNNSETFSFKRLWVLILLPIAFIIIWQAKTNPEFCETYSKNIYPILSGSLNYLFSMTEISIAQIILTVIAALLVFYTLTTILGLIFAGGRFKRILTYIVNIVCIFSMIVFFFSVTCGINYYRPSFAETEGIEVTGATTEELSELLSEIVLRINEAEENFDGKYRSFSENAEIAAESIAKLSEKYPSLSGEYGNPKPVSFFGFMSMSRITGFFFPFTYEANVNETIPKISIPSTMCHELAHLRGNMREDEANFIAFLSCMQSGDPEFIYSGLMLAYSHTASALNKYDPELCRQIIDGLSDDVKKDISEKNKYWAKYEGPVAEISDSVNDLYLKANDQKDGVKSYGRMVDLLISEFRNNGLDIPKAEEETVEENIETNE